MRCIQRMVEENASCADVLTQIAAARAALDAAGLAIFDSHVDDCLDHDGAKPTEAGELVTAAGRFVRR